MLDQYAKSSVSLAENQKTRLLSPLRYPGGKARIAPILAQTIHLNSLTSCRYYEPFAGGAGAALCLLADRVVSELHLNDADPRIYAFWKTALDEGERLQEAIQLANLSIAEWHIQHAICMNPRGHSRFSIGFATLYMNRCNRSGVIMGAGPIGGYDQKGTYKLDARFYRETLVRRLKALETYRDAIHIYQLDARDFLKRNVPLGCNRATVFVYLDPPYYDNGKRLYLNYYDACDHRDLSRYLLKQSKLIWLLSYDNLPAITHLYRRCRCSVTSVHYSLNQHAQSNELMISPYHVALPRSRPLSTQTSRALSPSSK